MLTEGVSSVRGGYASLRFLLKDRWGFFFFVVILYFVSYIISYIFMYNVLDSMLYFIVAARISELACLVIM